MKRLGIILFTLSLFPLINLLTPGIMDAHDAPDHVARIANFYQSLAEGNIVPRWAANLNWGYGHPILMFLYPLPSYLASLFHALGIALVDSVKLVFAVSYVAGIVAFFLWAGLAWGPFAGFVGALLYGFAPYRFVDLYVRGALGEHVAFVFMPVIFLGLWGLAKKKGGWFSVWLTMGTAGLLLSHNAVSLMMVPLVLLYIWYLWAYETRDHRAFLLRVLAYMGFGFAVSAFFWIPAFFEGKYTLRDIVIKGEFASRFVPFSQFFYSPWSFGIFTKEVGIAQLLAVAAGFAVAVRSQVLKDRFFLLAAGLGLAGSLLVMTQWSKPLWETVTILQKFQFPWRFLTASVFISAIMGSAVVAMMPKKRAVYGWMLVGVALITTLPMWKAKSYTVRPQSYYTGIYNSTTDTGESSPVWSVRFMEHTSAAPMELIDGEVEIRLISRSSTVHEYEVTAGKDSRLVENTLYFPGWRVLVDGAVVPVEFQDPGNRGLMTFWVTKGMHRVRVEFIDTKLRKAANAISLFGLFTFGLIVTIQLWLTKKRRR